MKNFKLMMLGTVAVLGLSVPEAQAQNRSSFPPHHTVYYDEYVHLLSSRQMLELNRYLDYEFREPCQNYRRPPHGFYREGCTLMYRYEQPVAKAAEPAQAEHRTGDVNVSEILTSYKIHFAYDSSAIEPAANVTLDQIAREIAKFNPREVTVAGHTDRAGPTDYNVRLSQRRADAISKALTERGVANRVISKEAHGETDTAVETKDGVALRENRRVIVDFLK